MIPISWLADEDERYGEHPEDGLDSPLRAALACLGRGRVRFDVNGDALVTVTAFEIDRAAGEWRRVLTETVRVRASVDRAESLVPCPTCGTGFRARDVPERMREAMEDRA